LIYPFASIGHAPQDLKFKGEASYVEIGANTTIREYVTIQPGTEGGIMKTTVGENCLLMVGVHVAHDCIVGNNVVMANYATLAGHVTIGNFVTVGGLSAIKQFIRVGDYAMIGGMSGVEKDVVPYAIIMGERASLHGINIIGLRRNGFSNDEITLIQDIFKELFNNESSIPFQERVQITKRKEHAHNNNKINMLIDFVDIISKNSYCTYKN
jgi:UDP-N-acetylglucosamine acyltransferase